METSGFSLLYGDHQLSIQSQNVLR